MPDEGFGSTTRGLTKVGAGTLGIVGSKNLVDGSTEAMYWRLDPDAAAPNGFRITATGFGGCTAGANCAATGIAFADDDPERPIIVGSASPGGLSRALGGLPRLSVPSHPACFGVARYVHVPAGTAASVQVRAVIDPLHDDPTD